MSPSDARTQAAAESRFFAHVGAFVVGMALAVGAALVLGGLRWAAVAGVAWALVLAAHAAAVFRTVLSAEWIEQRAADLRAADDTLVVVERRLVAVEAALAPADVADVFHPEEAAVVGRPTGPSPRDAAFADDPFGAVRAPIDTPRLGGPLRKAEG